MAEKSHNNEPLAQSLNASSEKLRSEPWSPAAWHQASERSYRGDSANSVWKHLEQYRKMWADSLEQFQKVMETGQPYLKTWTEFP